jgi:hypothetical protein
VVSELLGHGQIGITMDLYSHVTVTMQEQTVRAFDDLLAVNLAAGTGSGGATPQVGPVAQSVRAADS